MNAPSSLFLHEDENNNEEVFLDESDIIQEVDLDNENLPDADEGSDMEQNGEIYTVACSPIYATLVATGGGDDKGFLWRTGQGDWASELQGHGDLVSSLAFSNDGQLLASGSLDRIVQVRDVFGIWKSQMCSGRWHPGGHLLLVVSEDCTVWMWKADKGAFLNTFAGHGGSVTCGDFTPDGKIICTGSDDATMRIWNPKSREN